MGGVGIELGVKGEKDYKESIKSINEVTRMLSAEMKAVANQFEKNDTSLEASAAKHDVLTKQIDAQKAKIAETQRALDGAKAAYGANSSQAIEWQRQLNLGTAALNKMERELTACERNMVAGGKTTETAAEAFKRLTGEVGATEREYAKVVAETGEASTAAKVLSERLERLKQEQRAAGEAAGGMGDGVAKSKASFKDLEGLLGSGFKSALDDSTGGARKASDAYEGLGGLLGKNVKKSLDDVKGSLVDTASKVVSGVGEMSGSVVQFGKDTLSGENTVKALGDAIRDKLQERLSGASKDLKNVSGATDEFGKSLDGAGGELDNTGKKTKKLGDEMDDAGKKTSIFGDVLKANLAADAIVASLGAMIDVVKSAGAAAGVFVDESMEKAAAFTQSQTLLTQVMQNTMDASDAEVASMIKLAEAQEEVGVVSKTAQVTALAELASFVEKKDALEGMLPVMNDYVAYQYGASASADQARNVATALGKAIQGNIDGLAKQGFTLSANEKEWFKTASEAQRTAFVMDMVSESMGGVNEALAQTDAGKMAKLNTVIDNTKIAVGEMANEMKAQVLGGMLPSISSLSDAFLGLLQGEGSIEDMAATFDGVFEQIATTIEEFLPKIIDLGGDILVAIAQGVSENMDTIVAGAQKIIEMLCAALSDLVPPLMEAGVKLLAGLLEGVVKALPDLSQAATDIIAELVKGLGEAMPALIPAAVDAITTIAQGLIDNMPTILGAALELIEGLTRGLLDALPGLIDELPKIIKGIVDFLIGSIPMIIATGVTLLTALVGALPDIIASIVDVVPQIVSSIISALIENLPLIINAGITLLTALVGALPQIISTICTALPQIITGIVDALPQLIPALLRGVIDLIVGVVSNTGAIVSAVARSLVPIIKGIWDAGIALIKSCGSLIVAFFSGGTEAVEGQMKEALSESTKAIVKGQEIAGAAAAKITADTIKTKADMQIQADDEALQRQKAANAALAQDGREAREAERIAQTEAREQAEADAEKAKERANEQAKRDGKAAADELRDMQRAANEQAKRDQQEAVAQRRELDRLANEQAKKEQQAAIKEMQDGFSLANEASKKEQQAAIEKVREQHRLANEKTRKEQSVALAELQEAHRAFNDKTKKEQQAAIDKLKEARKTASNEDKEKLDKAIAEMAEAHKEGNDKTKREQSAALADMREAQRTANDETKRDQQAMLANMRDAQKSANGESKREQQALIADLKDAQKSANEDSKREQQAIIKSMRESDWDANEATKIQQRLTLDALKNDVKDGNVAAIREKLASARQMFNIRKEASEAEKGEQSALLSEQKTFLYEQSAAKAKAGTEDQQAQKDRNTETTEDLAQTHRKQETILGSLLATFKETLAKKIPEQQAASKKSNDAWAGDMQQSIDAVAKATPDTGKSIVEGLVEGIRSREAWAKKQVALFNDSIKKQFADDFDIHSPSRYFQRMVGAPMAEGLAEGFTAAMRNVTREMQAAVPTRFEADVDVNGSGTPGRGGDSRGQQGGQQGYGSFCRDVYITSDEPVTMRNSNKKLRELKRKLGEGAPA